MEPEVRLLVFIARELHMEERMLTARAHWQLSRAPDPSSLLLECAFFLQAWMEAGGSVSVMVTVKP